MPTLQDAAAAAGSVGEAEVEVEAELQRYAELGVTSCGRWCSR